MTKQRRRSVPLYIATFSVLVVLSVSNLFAWPRALTDYRGFAGNSLANSVLNGSLNRPMNPGIAVAYLMITTSVNYVISLTMKMRPWWKGVGLFIMAYLLVSIAVSVATMALFLVGEEGR